MKSFNAIIVYTNTAHDDDPRCKQSPCPNVNEYNDITMLRSKIIDLQYFLYRPDYILVEFDGMIYDATNFNSEDSKELFKKLMNWQNYLNKGKYDRNYNLAFSKIYHWN